MKFEREYTVEATDVGKNNSMTNYAFLGILEEIATYHSNLCGYGVEDIKTKGKGWILMDWKLKVFHRPKYADDLQVKTWARKAEKHLLYTYRDFEIFKRRKIGCNCNIKMGSF